MTSEEIIQRLLDEKKITVKEAMIILKDLAKIGLGEVRKWLPDYIPIPEPKIEPDKKWPPYDVVVMYGVNTNPYTWNANNGTTINGDISNGDLISDIDNNEKKG